MFLIILITILISFEIDVQCSRILVIIPAPSYSHQIFSRNIVYKLIERGHEVVYITANPINDTNLTNLTEIDISMIYRALNFYSQNDHEYINVFEGEQSHFLQQSVESITVDSMYPIFTSPDVQNLIINKNNQKFDLVIVEYGIRCFGAFSIVYNCPMIPMMSFPQLFFHDYELRNPLPLIHQFDLNSPFEHPLKFWNKISIIWAYWKFYRIFMIIGDYHENAIIKRYFGQHMPSLYDIYKRVYVALFNQHPVFTGVRPNLPGIIDIGGSHQPKLKLLPKDLQNYLDNATNGAIYISFGGNVPDSRLNPAFVKTMINVFNVLPYKVLWKIESKCIGNIADNIFTQTWMPQFDVLSHPNVKVFITQGGLQSLEETIHARTPIIGIPFFADQFANVKRAERMGYGIALSYNTMNESDLKNAIISIMHNTSFQQSIENVAKILENQIVPPMEKAIWWIEHVIETKGASYLRSPAIDYTSFEYYYIDVFLILQLFLLCMTGIICYIFYNCYRKLCSYFQRKIKTA